MSHITQDIAVVLFERSNVKDDNLATTNKTEVI